MRRERGFSLIELLMVAGILLVIAAIAVPNFLRSRVAANEASAVASMQAIATAENTYAVTYPQVGYADKLAKLGAPVGYATASAEAAGLLDPVLGCAEQPCAKSGYLFALSNATGTPASSFQLRAFPQVIGKTGRRSFCTDQKGLIAFDMAGDANDVATCSPVPPTSEMNR